MGNNITRIFSRKYVLFDTLSDVSRLVLNNSAYSSVLREIGLASDETSLRDDVYHRLSLLLLQPSDEIQRAIDNFLRTHDINHCVGVQIRSGGSTAVHAEHKSFLSYTSVRRSASEINYNAEYAGRPVFLTTDSNLFNNMVPGMLNKLKVCSSDVFAIGHSSLHFAWGSNHLNALKRSIVDLLLISRCDDLFVTYGSSYGRLCDWLSNAQSVHILRNWVCLFESSRTLSRIRILASSSGESVRKRETYSIRTLLSKITPILGLR